MKNGRRNHMTMMVTRPCPPRTGKCRQPLLLRMAVLAQCYATMDAPQISTLREEDSPLPQFRPVPDKARVKLLPKHIPNDPPLNSTFSSPFLLLSLPLRTRTARTKTTTKKINSSTTTMTSPYRPLLYLRLRNSRKQTWQNGLENRKEWIPLDPPEQG